MTSLGMSCVKLLLQISSNELQRFDRIVCCACAGNAGIVFPPPRVSDPEMHHGTYVTHVPWCIPGLLTSGFLWSRWRGKRSRHSRRMRNPQFYVSGKRPMATRRHAVLDDQSNSLDLEPVNMCTNDQSNQNTNAVLKCHERQMANIKAQMPLSRSLYIRLDAHPFPWYFIKWTHIHLIDAYAIKINVNWTTNANVEVLLNESQ